MLPLICIFFNFLVSLSDSSLSVYKNATKFWIFILYPATLLNSLSVLVGFGGIFRVLFIQYHAICKYSFTTSFPIWMPFTSSSCLIAVSRTSSTMLNKRGESKHPCLVPNLKGNICSFCPLTMMLALGLSYMTFILLRYVPSISTLLRVFYHKWVWDFIECFFCIYWYDHVVFMLYFVMCYITLIDLWLLYQPCIPGKNPT